jgi:hypothetical protein
MPLWKIGRNLAAIAIGLTPVACHLGFAYEEKLIGDYGLIAVDVMEQMSVSKFRNGTGGVAVINETVFAVGCNNEFLIAKQHPNRGKIDRSVTNFYILRVSDGELFGPYTESEYRKARQWLRLPESLQFTRVFERLA